MPKQVKFTKEEIEELKNIQDSYIQTQNNFGSLAVSRIRLNQQNEDFNRMEAELEQSFLDTSRKEKEFVDKVTKKYGDGTFNPETGIFTPNSDK